MLSKDSSETIDLTSWDVATLSTNMAFKVSPPQQLITSTGELYNFVSVADAGKCKEPVKVSPPPQVCKPIEVSDDDYDEY